MEKDSLKVLVVEDEPGHAEAIRRAFKAVRPNDQVQVAGLLRTYRKFLDASIPDIVITDIQLPDGRALELLTAPAALGQFPVIVMTSYGNEQVAVDAIKAGANDYIVKSPETLRDMPRTVERVMREWALVQEHKKSQELIAAHQTELKAVYNGTPVMMCVLDSNRNVLSANRAFFEGAMVSESDLPETLPGGLLGCLNALDNPQGCGHGPDCDSCALRIAILDTLQTAKPHFDFECSLPVQRNGIVGTIALLGSITPLNPQNGSPRVLLSLLDITERKHAEQALKKSEARFRSYFNTFLLGIAITSVEKKWVEVNDHLCAMMGYSRDELMRMTWSEMTYLDDLSLDVEQFDRVLEGQIEQYTLEKRFIRKDGSTVWTSLGVGCVRHEDNTVDYIIAIIRDITERKQAEEKMLFLSEGNRIAAETSVACINVKCNEEFDLAVNEILRSVGRLFDADRSYFFSFFDDYKRMTNTNEWCASGVEPQIQRIQNQLTSDLPWWKQRILEGRTLQIPDVADLPPEAEAEKTEFISQSIRSLISVPTIGAQGQLSGFIGLDMVTRNVRWSEENVALLEVVAGIIGSTYERLQSMQKLQKSREKTSSILNAIDDVVLSTSLEDGTLNYVSPSFAQVFGKPVAAITVGALAWPDVIHPDDSDQVFNEYMTSIAQGSYHGEFRIIKDDGTISWLRLHAKVIYDDQEKPLRIDSYISDITERKLIEEKALQHLKELEQWYRATLNREGKVLELKNEVNELLKRLGETPKYSKKS